MEAGNLLEVFALLMADAAGAVQAEARMLPGEQHLGAVAGQKLLVYQASDHPAAEHLFQRPEDDLLGQRVEAPWGSKSPSATRAWRWGWKSTKYSPNV